MLTCPCALARIFVATPAQKSVPCRNRAALVKMIIGDFYDNFGATGAIRRCALLQRLGPPGALPVKPGGFLSRSNFSVNARRSDALKPE